MVGLISVTFDAENHQIFPAVVIPLSVLVMRLKVLAHMGRTQVHVALLAAPADVRARVQTDLRPIGRIDIGRGVAGVIYRLLDEQRLRVDLEEVVRNEGGDELIFLLLGQPLRVVTVQM